MKLFILIQENNEHALAVLVRETYSHAAAALGVEVVASIQPATTQPLRIPAATHSQDVLLLLCPAQQYSALQAEKATLLQRFGGAQFALCTLPEALKDVSARIQQLMADTPSSADSLPDAAASTPVAASISLLEMSD